MGSQTLIAVDPDTLAALMAEVREIRETLDRCVVTAKPEWLTMAEAQDQFGISTSTLYRWIEEGRIEARGRGKSRRVRALV